MKVLGVESSCDETALAIYDSARGLLANQIYSQIKLHQAYGGVVPELASREHGQKLLPLLRETLGEAKLTLADLDGVAYTAGPGLIGAVMVGAMFAKSLAYRLKIPALGVHHMEGHLLAPMLAENRPEFPFVALLVSGGHTMLVAVQGVGQYQLLGQTLDDAAGEAFDKAAKLLGLPYPGGPALAALAVEGDDKAFDFPRPMCDRPGLDFSFSGLKTSLLHTVKRLGELTPQMRRDLAASYQLAIVETLFFKARRALKASGMKRLVIAGGVSANQCLRQYLQQLQQDGIEVFCPPPAYCTDNAAMIAYAGWVRLAAGARESLALTVRPRWPLTELAPL